MIVPAVYMYIRKYIKIEKDAPQVTNNVLVNDSSNICNQGSYFTRSQFIIGLYERQIGPHFFFSRNNKKRSRYHEKRSHFNESINYLVITRKDPVITRNDIFYYNELIKNLVIIKYICIVVIILIFYSKKYIYNECSSFTRSKSPMQVNLFTFSVYLFIFPKR